MSAAVRSLPRTIWALGLVSLFMDISSEMINGLLPVFLVSSLGASAVLVGLIEGIAEATASITKVFSGWLSDRLGRRKLLTVLGYGLAAITKPIFPLAATPYEVLAARFVDRVGKGVRDAPRDALIADVTPPALRGASFGLRQSLDTVGAFVGPLAAVGLMEALNDNVRAVFSFAIIPAVIAVVVLVLWVKEPAASGGPRQAQAPIRWSEVQGIGAPFWIAVAVGVLFTMARFSEAFLVLRGSAVGIPLALVPFVLIVMNVVYAAVAAPVGSLSDRVGRKPLLAVGVAVLILADLVLASTSNIAGALDRGRALGRAPGSDPGPAGRAGGRHRAGSPAGHGVRPVQPGDRRDAAGGQRPGWRGLVGAGGAGDVPDRRRLRARRAAGRARAAAGAAPAAPAVMT